jgi:hypothetical protein
MWFQPCSNHHQHRESNHQWANYGLPGVTSNDTELILPDQDPPLHVTPGQVFRVWYGEDLFKSPADDNVGTLDIDVYAYYA